MGTCPLPGYATLEEALATGLLTVTEVSEAGPVPELTVLNDGPVPVFLLDGFGQDKQLFARGDRQPDERRPRQRHRQSRAALAHHDRPELWRKRARPAPRRRPRISPCLPAPTRSSGKRAGTCRASSSTSMSARPSKPCPRRTAISPTPSPGSSID